jgi:hypothetical protein
MDDVQKHRVTIHVTLEREIDLDIDMQDYAGWLEGGGDGGMEAYLDDAIHSPDFGHSLPNEWFDGVLYSTDILDATPVPVNEVTS